MGWYIGNREENLVLERFEQGASLAVPALED
jgi:hypothetical protein